MGLLPFMIQFLSFTFYFNVLWHLVLSQTPQPNVVSDGKSSGLFLWIYLKPGLDIRPALKLASNLHTIVKDLQTKSAGNADNEILTGIGFGTTLYGQVKNSTTRAYRLAHREGVLGSLPNTGGDLFIHAKCNNLGLLFELSQIVKEQLLFSSGPDLPTGFGFEDTYGFVYKNGRDLSGFIDGTENPVGKERSVIAIDANGGSYCITQKWIHNLDFIHQQSVEYLEGVIGRRMNDSKELDPKPATSHVARMTSGPQFKASKPVQMYRQSMPYGTLGSKAGLFFIGFANDPNNFDYFLNRMVSQDYNKSDDVMRISTCQSGNYWYFPSMEELQNLAIMATPANNNAENNNTNSSNPSQNENRFLFKPKFEDDEARKNAAKALSDTGQNCQKSFKSNNNGGQSVKIGENSKFLLIFLMNLSFFVLLKL